MITTESDSLESSFLAGGIMQEVYQCGMLWGAALGVGAESYRRHDDPARAIATAITATQCIKNGGCAELIDSLAKI